MALRLHAHRERAVDPRPGPGGESIGDLLLDEEDNALGQRRRERLLE